MDINRCIICNIDMGPDNPRQLCRKTYCPDEFMQSIVDETDVVKIEEEENKTEEENDKTQEDNNKTQEDNDKVNETKIDSMPLAKKRKLSN